MAAEGESKAASVAAERPTAPDATERVRLRLHEITEERERWEAKRLERSAHRDRLKKLLEAAVEENGGANNAKADDNEEARSTKETAPPQKRTISQGGNASVAARKKQLQQLQKYVRAAEQKQQAAGNSLARKLKQLSVANNATAETASSVLPAKRKHSNEASTVQPGKKTAVAEAELAPGLSSLQTTAEKMHEFSDTVNLEAGSAELQEAACFRIATRHLVQTGKAISRHQLAQTFEGYTGQVLDEGVGQQALSLSLERLGIAESANQPRLNTHWQPGRQYLKSPTFSSYSTGRIQALIDTEKQTIASVCDPLRSSEKQHSSKGTLRDLRLRAQFLSGLLGDAVSTPGSVSVSSVLATCTGASAVKISARCEGRVAYRPRRQLVGVFMEMETWLREHARNDDRTSTAAENPRGFLGGTNGGSSASMTTKPFSLEDDSIVKQLRTIDSVDAGPAWKKLDPMKMLCHYELNGVCNDSNCPYQHQKDFDLPMGEGDEVGGTSVGIETDVAAPESKELQQVLVAFAEFRSNILTKWPLITSDAPPPTTPTHGDTAPKSIDTSKSSGHMDAATPAETFGSGDGDAGKDDSDFLALEDVTSDGGSTLGGENGSTTRYYDPTHSMANYGEALQKRVTENADDTDAWLLLAINQLEIDVGASDDAVNSAENSRLHKQLVFLSQALNVKLQKGHSRGLAVEETNLKRCLHTLSRALEVEANAYCEAVWLLYLHLCRQLTTRQTEVDMAEKSVQFLPMSHALWLRYLSTYEFDSITMAEEVHWRILQYLTRLGATGEESTASEKTADADLSRLSTAITLHLCMKLQRAGAESRAIELLSALVQLGEQSMELGWCSAVGAQLRAEEKTGLSLVITHLLVFRDIPAHAEHWVVASACKDIDLKGFAYAVDSAYWNWPHGRAGIDGDIERALQVYEQTFQMHQRDCSTLRDAGDVILNNWMVVLAQRSENEGAETLKKFLVDKSPFIQQHPAASLSAASITGIQLNDAPQACQVMFAMMNRSPATKFSEAFHYFLFACRKVSGLLESLDQKFPDVMVRLASVLGMDVDKMKSSIQIIKDDTDRMAKSTALKAILEDMLTSWMNQLAMQGRPVGQDQTAKDSAVQTPADIFVALDICELLDIMVEPSTAVDSLRVVLSASKFSSLPLEARQLAWSLRFVFEVDLLQREDPVGASWGEHRAEMTHLLREYLDSMSVEAELTRQVAQRITQEVSGKRIQEAVCSCLYPERRQLVSFDAILEVFQLCSAAVPRSEKAAFFASFTDTLALAPGFSLAFCETAEHEWEWRAARASLKRCLAGSKSLIAPHPEVLRALVAVELGQKSMKAVSSILESELQADPLLMETWRLVVAMEIIFGDPSAERSEKIAADMVKHRLVFTCNTFGDEALLHQSIPALGAEPGLTTLSLRGLGLGSVPNAVLLQDDLVALDLSGNLLVDLPVGLERLKKLQTLDVSENALLDLPACVGRLAALMELKLARNNLTAVPIPVLSQLPTLEKVDLRSNALTGLPASILGGLQSLKALQAEGNFIPATDLEDIAQKLSKSVDAGLEEGEIPMVLGSEGTAVAPSSSVSVQSSSSCQVDGAPQPERSADVGTGTVAVPSSTEGPQALDYVDMTASETKEDDGDQIMEPRNIIDLADSTPEMSSRTLETDMQSEGEHEVINVDDGGLDAADGAEEDTDSAVPTPSAAECPSANTELVPAATSMDGIGVMVATNPPYLAATLRSIRQDHADAVTKAAERQKISLDARHVASRALQAYMEGEQIDSRTDARERNPELWRKFVAANLPRRGKLGGCRMCLAPNDGRNQRFNGTVLCVRCLEDVLRVVKARGSSLEETKENS